jgi:hypothetical protein
MYAIAWETSGGRRSFLLQRQGGGTWSQVATLGSTATDVVNWYRVRVISATDVRIIGESDVGGTNYSRIWKWNGTVLSEQYSVLRSSKNFNDLWMESATDGWMLDDEGGSTPNDSVVDIGAGWAKKNDINGVGETQTKYTLCAANQDNAWVLGVDFATHWDGTSTPTFYQSFYTVVGVAYAENSAETATAADAVAVVTEGIPGNTSLVVTGASGNTYNREAGSWVYRPTGVGAEVTELSGVVPDSIFLPEGNTRFREYVGGGSFITRRDVAADQKAIHSTASGRCWLAGNSGAVGLWDGSYTAYNATGAGSVNFRAIWEFADGEVWAFGLGTQLYKRSTGGTWTGPFTIGSGLQVRAIWATDQNNVWVTGHSGLVAQWNGSIWTIHTLPGTLSGQAIWSVTGTSASDVWIIASTTNFPVGHWDGGAWSESSFVSASFATPTTDFHQRARIFATAPDDVWALVKVSSVPRVYRYLTSWIAEPALPAGNASIYSLVAIPTNPLGTAYTERSDETVTAVDSLGLTEAGPSQCTPGGTRIFYDSFDDGIQSLPTLAGNGTVTETGGNLVVTANGVNTDWWTFGRNGILAYAPIPTFYAPGRRIQVETELSSLTNPSPSDSHLMWGLRVDDGNFVYFGVNATSLWVGGTSGFASWWSAASTAVTTPVKMRISWVPDQNRVTYSYHDGTDWQQLYTFTSYSFTYGQVFFYSKSWSSLPQTIGNWNYLRICQFADAARPAETAGLPDEDRASLQLPRNRSLGEPEHPRWDCAAQPGEASRRRISRRRVHHVGLCSVQR